MRITIANRLKPFTHLPGLPMLLPGLDLMLKIYPAFIEVVGKGGIDLDIQGPVKGFTVINDMEKGFIQVFGQAANGYFRYTLQAHLKGGFSLSIDKPKSDELKISSDLPKEIFDQENKEPLYSVSDFPRLSFGCHKKQEWDQVHKRRDLAEFLPFLYRQTFLQASPKKSIKGGTAEIISEWKELLESGKRLDYGALYKKYFLAAFHGLLVPRLTDTDHQGFGFSEPDLNQNPFSLLEHGRELIEGHFISFKEDELSLLPSLPLELHCGRITNFKVTDEVVLDFEWSKKVIKRAILHVKVPKKLAIKAFDGIRSFRLRRKRGDAGERFTCDHLLSLDEPGEYLVDRFEKSSTV